MSDTIETPTDLVTIGTSQTWAYINDQIELRRRYAVHVSTPDFEPICGRGKPLDETGRVSVEWFMEYVWGCKFCKRLLSKQRIESP